MVWMHFFCIYEGIRVQANTEFEVCLQSAAEFLVHTYWLLTIQQTAKDILIITEYYHCSYLFDFLSND